MRVLVACEESQCVTMAFRELGHLAFSCDLQDCSGGFPQYHIKGNVIPVIENNSWDIIIAHPPCTYLCVAGANNMYKDGVIVPWRYEQMLKAKEFFMYFYNLQGVKVAIENPRPMKLCQLPIHTQVIQPFEFGDNYTKQTCLWLKDLPPLIGSCYGINRRGIGMNIDSWCGVVHGSVQRSKTFKGIANAMAMQWG